MPNPGCHRYIVWTTCRRWCGRAGGEVGCQQNCRKCRLGQRMRWFWSTHCWAAVLSLLSYPNRLGQLRHIKLASFPSLVDAFPPVVNLGSHELQASSLLGFSPFAWLSSWFCEIFHQSQQHFVRRLLLRCQAVLFMNLCHIEITCCLFGCKFKTFLRIS